MEDSRQVPRDLAARLGQETVAILRAGGYTSGTGRQVVLREALAAARVNTVEYPPARQPPSPARDRAAMRITVRDATVLDVGRRMAAAGPVAALNFASATHPGGGFLGGARAQEESIARSSGLFHALDGRHMYAFHRTNPDAMHSDYALYTPDVPVFRTDAGELLDNPWYLSVVTCAAVHGKALGRYAPHRLPEVPAVMAARTARVLSVAAEQGVRRFILGAWGCGAFGLEPGMMAHIFHDALHGAFHGVFEEIVFAVADWSPERMFIGPFEQLFSPERGTSASIV